jgi:hypothetical protein
MKRSQRLQNAKVWMKKYEGNNIIKSYAKWYGVDKFCAFTELEILGMKFSEKKKAQVLQREANRARQKQIQKEKRKRKAALAEEYYDFDETFAFIAGYTEGGVPFGITYEEMEEYETQEAGFVEVGNSHNKEHAFDTGDALTNRWGCNDWFFASFDWESYFGDFPLVQDQEQLIYELNRFDIQLQIQEIIKSGIVGLP